MSALQDYIEVVECAYETMLAYAAQGKESDLAGSQPSEIRITLCGLQEAMLKICDVLSESSFDFAKVVQDDIKKADAALNMVLAQAGLGSELIDNLNASIHLRAVLTDLFLIDETHT